MGWLLTALGVLALLALLALLLPELFGPVLAGLAPLILVVALIGIGGVWWRRSQGRVDSRPKEDHPADGA